MVKVLVFFQNESPTTDPAFDELSEQLQGENIQLNRIPCVGELIYFPDPANPKHDEVYFQVIQVAQGATMRNEKPDRTEGIILLSRCRFSPKWS